MFNLQFLTWRTTYGRPYYSVTLRERDSCEQVRVAVADVPALVKKLCDLTSTWGEATAALEKVAAAPEE